MRSHPSWSALPTQTVRVLNIIVVLRPADRPDDRVVVSGSETAPYEAMARGRFMALALARHPRHDVVGVVSSEASPQPVVSEAGDV